MVTRRLFPFDVEPPSPGGRRLPDRVAEAAPGDGAPAGGGDRCDAGDGRAFHDRLPPAPAGGALSRCDRGMPFEWTLNPYRGCEFGCGYCYARTTHRFLGLDDPRDFERRIFWKEDLPRLLARDLERRVAPGQRIAVGTATDPYQALERRLEITRGCLRVFARHAGLRVSLTTKSDLAVRDLDLLRVLSRRSSLHVNFSISTMDRRLARDLEPLAPTPERRLHALRALAAEGIETGVLLMPVLPGLTDGPGAIEEVVSRAAEAGAGFLCHQVVFLREPTRGFWMDFLKARYPALVRRYGAWFAGGPYADEDLRAAVARRVSRARRAAGLADGPADRGTADPQLRLFA